MARFHCRGRRGRPGRTPPGRPLEPAAARIIPSLAPLRCKGAVPIRPGAGGRPPAVLVNRPHAGSEGFVAALSCRTLSLTPRIEPARGDTEHSGHRSDAQLGLMRSHEPVDLPGPTSRANQAVAFASIARSSRTRRFSRRSRRISSRSALLSPSPRRPSSRSACATQLRIAWAVGSNSRASSSAVRPVRTKATRRPSGAGRLAGTAVSISAWWIPPPPRVRGPRNRGNSNWARPTREWCAASRAR